MKCWAKGYCKRHNTEKCHEHCDVYVILKAIYSQTYLPKKYQYEKAIKPQQEDLGAFRLLSKWREDIVEHVEDGDNLFLYSPTTGNGKTSWATKMANFYIRKTVFTGKIENLVLYINVTDFLEKLRASYKGEVEGIDELKAKLRKAKIVIMDDLGAEKPSEWARERLYEVINHRDNEMLTTIYTSNLSIDKIEERLGSRIASRVRNSTVVKLVGEDRRGGVE